ncbi:hypothetical protein [Cupriavidus sp. IDO]|uniref:hypothetical protein n=1 Tax=Cupriavidus sp. IDO TaxID=1539142 RepID=UPI00057996BF|nr:hypothetical protein [Cupriavidus sp. IDO]KWR75578.1 hypothetical protein RM96_34195 [Cupriavidus sp. IDO]
MIVKPHPAAVEATLLAAPVAAFPAMSPVANLSMFPSLRPGRVAVRARRALPAAAILLVAAWAALAPVRESHAQASVPAAAALAPDAGAPRDFAAERKAIGDSRAWTNYRFATAERACYDKFFVNSCIDKAKEVQREELAVLRKRELEVGEAERAHRAAERDREQALRNAEYEAGQPQRSANEKASRAAFDKKQQDQQLRDAQRQADAPNRAANAQAYEKKQSDFDARMKEAQEKGAEQARQRQENAKAFEAKQREAAQRQKELDERRARAKEQQQGGGASAPRPFGF